MKFEELNDGGLIINNMPLQFIYLEKQRGDVYTSYGFGDQSIVMSNLDVHAWNDYFEEFVDVDNYLRRPDPKHLRQLLTDLMKYGIEEF